jgi:ABC-type lipoprotein export system ATPase subunit
MLGAANLREGDHSFLKGATGSGKTYAFYISRGLHFVLDRSESCFFCGGKGHYETECQTSEEELKKYRTEAGLCFQCGSVGHFKDFCPWAVEKEAAL